MADIIYVRHRIPEYRAFRSPTGMTGRWTLEQAEKVAAHARVVTAPGQGKGYATGETSRNIRVDGPTVGRSGPEADVVAHTDHAIHLHEGTPPHEIRPRAKEKLVFFWRKRGQVVFADKVRHPGTKARPFLVDALKKVFGGPGR